MSLDPAELRRQRILQNSQKRLELLMGKTAFDVFSNQ